MFVDVNETVEMIVVFKKHKTVPVSIRWNDKTYNIKQISMVHKAYSGNGLVYYFSVSDNFNYFKLAFDTKTLQWHLEQVYHEG